MAVPLLGTTPVRPLAGGTVMGLLYSAPGAVVGTSVSFTLATFVAGTTSTATGTDVVDPSGQAQSPALTVGSPGQYTLTCVLGTLLVAQCGFIVS